MSKMYRHIGELVNTGSRVAVVYMQIPDAEHKTLVLQVDGLPDYYRELIGKALVSPEGQAAANFGDYLGRIKVEGQNKDMLTLMHEAGQLIPIAIDNVYLTPMPNAKYPMRDVLVSMGKKVPLSGEKPAPKVEKRYNPFEENQQADLEANRRIIANGLLGQAADLEAEAARLRERAYQTAPDLRPVSTVNFDAAPAATDVFGLGGETIAEPDAIYGLDLGNTESEQIAFPFNNLGQ